MLTHLRLERFKNFNDAELSLGPLTLLVGANGSGKSNVRDAYNAPRNLDRGISYNAVSERVGERRWRHSAISTVRSSKPR